MSRQFNRLAEVYIANTETTESFSISNLRISFKVTNKDSADDSKAEIKIYNLNGTKRSVLVAGQREDGTGKIEVDLRCGYEGESPKTIFKGVCTAENSHVPPEWVSTLKGEGGVSSVLTSDFEKTYPAGTPIRKIVEDIAASLSLEVDSKGGGIKGSLNKARTFSGPIRETVERLQSRYGFQFTVNSGKVLIQERSDDPALTDVLLTKNTGLISKPISHGEFVKVRCLINPSIVAGTSIDLRSADNTPLSGRYTVKETEITGDNWSGDWSMEVTLSRKGSGLVQYFGDVGGSIA